jgi:histidine triad (HIT) family protein
MQDCIFCRIIKNEIPSKKVYEDEFVVAFCDIAPMAATHYLFVHKEHTKNVNEMNPTQIAQVFAAIKAFTHGSVLENYGFRIVTNTGKDAGQSVFHTHFHLLGGEKLGGFA